MKTSSLLYATLIASTAWAVDSYDFFVKYEGVIEPLVMVNPSGGSKQPSLLVHKVVYGIPVKFEVDGVFPTSEMTSEYGIPGLVNGLLSLGGDTPKTLFSVDASEKITNAKFQSCEIYDSPIRGLVYGETTVPTKDCKDVDVYIALDYRKDEDIPDDKNLRVPNLPKTDYIFFVEENHSFVALSALRLRGDDKNEFVLAQLSRNPSPVGFKFDGSSATTEAKPVQGNAGLANGMLRVGGKAPNTPFTLDDKNRILTGDFQSCLLYDSLERGILYGETKIPHSECHPVNVYILSNQIHAENEPEDGSPSSCLSSSESPSTRPSPTGSSPTGSEEKEASK